jgi:predicted CopG family antitoxin
MYEVMEKSTILVRNMTRERLKHMGEKGQTYDDLINQLIDMKVKKTDQNSLDRRFETLRSSESFQ